jgi:enterochelin esterase family protein
MTVAGRATQPPLVEYQEVHSPLLEGNPLGDPADRLLPVVLPPSYPHEPGRRYPVIHWLAGFGSSGATLLAEHLSTPSIARWLTEAMLAGRAPEAIVALPDCTTRYGGSQYVDSPATGAYQSHLVDELVGLVDERYRTVPEPAMRAVLGRSSGGYGALMAVVDRPGVFGAAFCHSPDAGFEHCYLAHLPRALDTYEALGGYERFVEAPAELAPRDGAFMLAMSLVAMASCYSPDPGCPGGFAFPACTRTGVLDDDVWARWLGRDPARFGADRLAPLTGLRYLLLDVGRRDEYHHHWGTRALHANLARHGVAHVYAEHDGGHQGTTHRHALSMSALADLWGGAPCAASPAS